MWVVKPIEVASVINRRGLALGYGYGYEYEYQIYLPAIDTLVTGKFSPRSNSKVPVGEAYTFIRPTDFLCNRGEVVPHSKKKLVFLAPVSSALYLKQQLVVGKVSRQSSTEYNSAICVPAQLILTNLLPVQPSSIWSTMLLFSIIQGHSSVVVTVLSSFLVK